MSRSDFKTIYVYADWRELDGAQLMGRLQVTPARGKEVFSFHYERQWLASAPALGLDPQLQLFTGLQYPASEATNFGLFLDSSPDRWGRVLMRRRENLLARDESRPARTLYESDYLLGVYDGHRMGGLRFKLALDGPFLDDDSELASPPWTRLRELENASLQLENEDAELDERYRQWLKMLISPGGSLGGTRPKAGVLDESGELWIAKFPSKNDDLDVGGWEFVAHQLAKKALIKTSPAELRKFAGPHHTFLTRRFDRDAATRIHFASAMTLLGRKDGEAADEGVSYLDMVEFIIKNGAAVDADLEELWRRIVFNICISNVDDHLRNHGFLLTNKGWRLAPAYDMNPSETGEGLKLNISTDDNSQSLELTLEVAKYFHLKAPAAKFIVQEVVGAVAEWRSVAKAHVSARETSRMSHAFRIADAANVRS